MTGPDHGLKIRNSQNKAKGVESRLVATALLTRIVDDGRNLDALCDRKHGIRQFLELDGRDQSLARAIAVTALRHRNRIDFVFKKLMNRPPPKNARFLIHSLHVAAAQILFMEVPESAAVNVAVSAIGNDKRTSRFKDLANAVLRRMVREKDKLLETSKGVSPLPDWLTKTLRSNYGKENTVRIAQAVSHGSALDISVKSNAEQWVEKL
ncbi:MAG: transcription antitermination factor NusB, partial [Pseudomonadota bacterium]